ncbi:hypothetical protein MRX96_022243 [Rhipicephalus microplus]
MAQRFLTLEAAIDLLFSLPDDESRNKFISPEYLGSLAEPTARYALQKREEVDVTEVDIGQFFGILLFSSYHSVPSEDSYRSTAEDLCVPIVVTVMARNRFRQLKRFFHVVDNTQLKGGETIGQTSAVLRRNL